MVGREEPSTRTFLTKRSSSASPLTPSNGTGHEGGLSPLDGLEDPPAPWSKAVDGRGPSAATSPRRYWAGGHARLPARDPRGGAGPSRRSPRPRALEGPRPAIPVDGAACGCWSTASSRSTTSPGSWPKAEPAAACGARPGSWDRLNESLLGFGPPVLEPRTVEVMAASTATACPTWSSPARSSPGPRRAGGRELLGGPAAGFRARRHGLFPGPADPDAGLVSSSWPTGCRPAPQRAAYVRGHRRPLRALGDAVARFRLPSRPLPEAFRLAR